MNPSPTNTPTLISRLPFFTYAYACLRWPYVEFLFVTIPVIITKTSLGAAPLTMSNRSVNTREVSCFCRSGADGAKNQPGWCQVGGN